MTTAYSLLPDQPPPPGAVFAGKVSRASPVQVTLDAYSDMHEWPGGSQAATWMTPGTPPVRGARALVFIDDQGDLWAFDEAAGAKTGRATLVAGTVTVNDARVTEATDIFLTCQVPGGTPGFLYVSARTVGASFTIQSGSATDTSTVGWMMVEPA